MKGYWRWIMAVFFLTLPALVGAQAPVKVGFVDVQRVLLQTKRGQEARVKMQTEVLQKQKEISAQEEEVRKMETDLRKQATILSEAARREREETVQRRKRDLVRTVEDFNRDLAKREQELLSDFLKEISVIVQEFGAEKGFTLILERQQGGILYANEGIDITKEIIERFDKKKESTGEGKK